MDSKFTVKILGRSGVAGETSKVQIQKDQKSYVIFMMGAFSRTTFYLPDEYLSELWYTHVFFGMLNLDTVSEFLKFTIKVNNTIFVVKNVEWIIIIKEI